MKSILLFLNMCMIATLRLSAQEGLLAEYYNGQNFDTFVGKHIVSNLDFYWDQFGPLGGLDPHDCSVRYTGQLRTPRSGEITFSARVDDGIRVWINDVLLINNWQLNDVGYAKGRMHMEADIEYNIKVEYFNAMKEAELHLFWKLPEDENKNWFSKWWEGSEPKVIPPEFFTLPSKEVEPVELMPEAKPESESKPPVVKPSVNQESNPIAETKPPVVNKTKPKIEEELKQYIPNSVEFELGKAEILAISYPELNTLAAFLVNNPNRKVDIAGHTDYIGDASKNLELSERRAVAVAAYLVKNGVHHTQIVSAKGYGGTQPIVKSNKKHHPENRRVEFTIK